MEKEEIRVRIGTILNDHCVDMLNEDGTELVIALENFIQQEIDRAFNRGYAECKKDIAIGVGFAEDPEFSKLVSRVAKKLN